MNISPRMLKIGIFGIVVSAILTAPDALAQGVPFKKFSDANRIVADMATIHGRATACGIVWVRSTELSKQQIQRLQAILTERDDIFTYLEKSGFIFDQLMELDKTYKSNKNISTQRNANKRDTMVKTGNVMSFTIECFDDLKDPEWLIDPMDELKKILE
jgi:hypothetical protein